MTRTASAWPCRERSPSKSDVLSESQQDGLAVQYGAIDWQGGHGITDPRERLRIVAGLPGPKADLIAVFPGNDPIPVELDLMEPTGSGRWPVRQRRLARQDEAGRLG